MDYISYKDAERLFEVWPMLKQIKQSTVMELQLINGVNNKESIDEWIYTLSVGNKAIDGLPHSRTASSPTENVAINYDKNIAKDILNSKDEIQLELMVLHLVDEKLKIAFDGLSELQQEILKQFYWQKKMWSEIQLHLENKRQFMSIYQAQMQRKEAITKMTLTSRITEKVYTDVMKIIDRGGEKG